jgi:hypothetical protein
VLIKYIYSAPAANVELYSISYCILIENNLICCYLEPYKSRHLFFTTIMKHQLRKHFVLCSIQTTHAMLGKTAKVLFFLSLFLALISLVVTTEFVKLSSYDIKNHTQILKTKPPKRTSILRANCLFSASKD